jgi:hypothetical protein
MYAHTHIHIYVKQKTDHSTREKEKKVINQYIFQYI